MRLFVVEGYSILQPKPVEADGLFVVEVPVHIRDVLAHPRYAQWETCQGRGLASPRH